MRTLKYLAVIASTVVCVLVLDTLMIMAVQFITAGGFGLVSSVWIIGGAVLMIGGSTIPPFWLAEKITSDDKYASVIVAVILAYFRLNALVSFYTDGNLMWEEQAAPVITLTFAAGAAIWLARERWLKG